MIARRYSTITTGAYSAVVYWGYGNRPFPLVITNLISLQSRSDQLLHGCSMVLTFVSVFPRRATALVRTSRACLATTSSAAEASATATYAAKPGHLYVVSTPIGNMGDITERAKTILCSVDVIAAEDTRHTGQLLKSVLPKQHTRPRLLSCYEHNATNRTPELLSLLDDSRSIALVSDAGTPILSDPGLPIVRAVADAGFPIVPIPGPSALLAALVVSGLPLNSFTFLGFIPRSGKDRATALNQISNTLHTIAFYEAPHRIRATLAELAEILDDSRQLCIGRELTKKYETALRFNTPSEARDHFSADGGEEPRGEFVIMVAPTPSTRITNADDVASSAKISVSELATALLDEGVPVKTIAKALSASSTVNKKALYAYLLQLKAGSPTEKSDMQPTKTTEKEIE